MLFKVTISLDNISMVAQISSSVATCAVAILFKPEVVDHLDTDLREFTTKLNELHRPDNAYAITPAPMLVGIQT